MKAIMILIIAAGTVRGGSLGDERTLEVREIEFSSIASCRHAASQLVDAGRRSSDWSRTFSVEGSTGRMVVPAPNIIAECITR